MTTYGDKLQIANLKIPSGSTLPVKQTVKNRVFTPSLKTEETN